MRTREVLRWHNSVRDGYEIVLFAVGGLMLGILERAVDEVERWIDKRAERDDRVEEVAEWLHAAADTSDVERVHDYVREARQALAPLRRR